MSKENTPPQKRSPKEAHERDFIWQILLPIVLTFLVFIFISVSTTMKPAATTARWAAISTIWLVIPWMLVALIALAILVGLIYGMGKLLNIIPTYTIKLLDAIYLVKEKLEKAADASTKPVFFAEGISASIRSIFEKK